MPSENTELDEILENYKEWLVGTSTSEKTWMTKAEAKAALLAWHQSAVAESELKARLVELDLLEQAINNPNWTDANEFKLHRLKDLTERLAQLQQQNNHSKGGES